MSSLRLCKNVVIETLSFSLKFHKLVIMVQVREVWMCMTQFLVFMLVHMRFTRWVIGTMLVKMMLVMHVFMFVFHPFMFVFM